MYYNAPSETRMSGFYILYLAGPVLETPGYRGVSHLIEHMVCHSTDHLLSSFTEHSINNNAFTANNVVCYYMTGLDRSINAFREEYLNCITKAKIDPELFENEKSIVIQEYMDAFTNKNHAPYWNALRKHYNYAGPIGMLEDLQNLTHEMCVEFYQKHFNNPIVINVSKDSPFADLDMVGLTKDQFDILISSMVYDPFQKDAVNYSYNDTKDLLENKTSKDKVGIVFMAREQDESNTAMQELISDLLCNGLESPLYSELREKTGMVYSVGAWTQHMGNSAIFSILCASTPEFVANITSKIEDILTHPTKYISVDRFNSVMAGIKITKEIQQIESYKSHDLLLTPSSHSAESILDKVTYEETIEAIKGLTEGYSFYYE